MIRKSQSELAQPMRRYAGQTLIASRRQPNSNHAAGDHQKERH